MPVSWDSLREWRWIWGFSLGRGFGTTTMENYCIQNSWRILWMSWYILIPKDNIYIYYCSVNFLVLYKFVSKKKNCINLRGYCNQFYNSESIRIFPQCFSFQGEMIFHLYDFILLSQVWLIFWIGNFGDWSTFLVSFLNSCKTGLWPNRDYTHNMLSHIS